MIVVVVVVVVVIIIITIIGGGGGRMGIRVIDVDTLSGDSSSCPDLLE